MCSFNRLWLFNPEALCDVQSQYDIEETSP
jgi:hypothetical protein